MPDRGRNISANQAWECLCAEYNIEAKVEENGVFYITAQQIKEYKEPRLMAKWDSSEQLPSALKRRKLNILPVSRRQYVISDFLVYEAIPALEERVERMTHVELPEYETITADSITSEAAAINALVLSHILDDFLHSTENASTFNGRMSTGVFDYKIDTERHAVREIHVNNAQCEIDGGFENEESVVILEAKNVVHADFNVRQLYYPYRLWLNRIEKPIRLVFSIYSNQIFRLFEYRFEDPNDFSSIALVATKNYSLQDTEIDNDDLLRVRNNTPVTTDDSQSANETPFIQANSVDRVISLLENLYVQPMTRAEIAELMAFQERQSDYYYNAGRYLGLFERAIENDRRVVRLTPMGRMVYALPYKERQLKLVHLMLEHRILAEGFDYTIEHGELPTVSDIAARMRDLQVCGESQINRRASSVVSWLKWIFSLTR